MTKGPRVPKEVREAVDRRLHWHRDSETIFRLGAGLAGYWKGANGWWASRKGDEGVQGPFKSDSAARTWAELPTREKVQAQVVEDLARAKAKAKAKAAAVKKAKLKELAQRARERARAKRVREKQAKEKAKAKAKAQALARADAPANKTWAGLPKEARVLAKGQVWCMRRKGFAQHELLLVRPAKGGKWVCRTRIRPGRTWTKQTVLKNGASLTKSYRLLKPKG